MLRVVTVVRIILGAFMAFGGINYYFNFVPLPELTPATQAFMTQLEVSGLFDLAKVIEVTAGVLLLVNRFVPAAIAMLMPVSVVIFYTDMVLQNSLVSHAAGVMEASLQLVLLFAYAQYFMPLLTMRSSSNGWHALRHWRLDQPVSRNTEPTGI